MPPDPIATYRLQLNPRFGFSEATEIIDYLADLGISHLYTSPYLQAAAGSMHGYDVVDHSRVNSELGNAQSHEEFCKRILQAGLGQMIDVVPNHMAIIGRQNPWWWDVLENGPSSRFATFFDVDWEASEERWPNKVLLPILGDHYGRILESGQLKVQFENGWFRLYYHDQSFPLDPSSLSGFLDKVAQANNSELLAFLAQSYARLPRPTVTAARDVEHRHRDKAVLHELFSRYYNENEKAQKVIHSELEKLNQDTEALHELVEQQNYRLAFWRTANRDLGYRRFFDIKDLAGLRVEDVEVFKAVHALLIQWYLNGWVQGLRIDHPDGLRNPAEYFDRIQQVCPGSWVVAEKILQPNEKLPANWKVEGTTGYDFLNQVNELFIDPAGEEIFTKFYAELTGKEINFYYLVYQCKLLVLDELFGSELHALTTLFIQICEKQRRHRDYTRVELREALCQTAAFFPVYRAYLSTIDRQASPEDTKNISQAIDLAMKAKPDVDPELFHFLRDLLLLKLPGSLEEELTMRFQQLTGPAMAKGFEDTALYRYLRLIALNEVGSDPSQFGDTVEHFHELCKQRQKEYPYSLMASTTHDTKRSEDIRARIAVLSEIPHEFAKNVKRWMSINERYRHHNLPDRNIEYLFYQTLLGAWPIETERMLAYMEKAAREAKEYTSWTKPNTEYELALREFIENAMKDELFLSDFNSFLAPLIYPGQLNSLSQTLIKLTAPGIPDIYQGCELWNLSLVDPDNRRLVDFSVRRQLLNELKNLSSEQVMARIEEGLPKLWIIWKSLHLRKKHPSLFTDEGTYVPLNVMGDSGNHFIAFMRAEKIISISTRFHLTLKNNWEDSSIDIPEGIWINHFTNDQVAGGSIKLQELLRRFPVALLERIS